MTNQTPMTVSKRELFYQELKRVLLNLYDPTVVNRSVILEWLAVENSTHSSFVLQDLIIQSIEALKPNLKTPASTKSRRTYQILRQRYIEQLNQEEVAINLSISTRQVQREEKIAREVLLDYLWARYQVKGKPVPAALTLDQQQAQVDLSEDQSESESIRQALLQITASVPQTQVILAQEILQVLNTLEPFTRHKGVEIKPDLGALTLPVQAVEPVLHQALTHLMMNMAKACAGNPIKIEAAQKAEEITITLSGVKAQQELEANLQASFELTVEMFRLCGGVLQAPDMSSADGYFELSVGFQAEKQLPVLIADDNLDSLRLLQRYLEGSAYQPTLIQTPQKVVETAIQLNPEAIIIDVMMPGQDGWMILTQLRKHPETRHIPVIVSTILPQRELAFTLGVADFLQKPVSQEKLLEALNRLVNPGAQAPG